MILTFFVFFSFLLFSGALGEVFGLVVKFSTSVYGVFTILVVSSPLSLAAGHLVDCLGSGVSVSVFSMFTFCG